ncbi:ribbon-helix-helix domain-containing protein [Fluviibacterium sp. DFM31]|uniref:Ribbon-helix-helix domain-containing protein n=1 Tax=Meridianimarinicoccus marinus TaxID=3231483 RepID=A0ABV3L835_9RHOB
MCQLFINAEADNWVSRTKSLRIDGMATSLRMENFFWDLLDEIATRDGMTVNQLITKLYLESLDAGHDTGNFTSFLRVCCARYLALATEGEIRRGDPQPLAEVDAAGILERETSRRAQARREVSRMN